MLHCEVSDEQEEHCMQCHLFCTAEDLTKEFLSIVMIINLRDWFPYYLKQSWTVSDNLSMKAAEQRFQLKVMLGRIEGSLWSGNLIWFAYRLGIYSAGEQVVNTWSPLGQAPFVGEEVTVHNTGISLLLSISVWVLLSSTIEGRETRPTASRPCPRTVWWIFKEGRPKFNPQPDRGLNSGTSGW